MKKRNPALVLVFSILTIGVYAIYWFTSTRSEMMATGSTIPPPWHIVVPFKNVIYLSKWCEGVERVTKGAMTTPQAMMMIIFLGPIGIMKIQQKFNEI